MKQESASPGAFHRIILFMNIIAAVSLLCALLSTKISPASMWISELISLSYPYLLFLNILFAFYWFIVRMKYALVSIIVILFGIKQFNLFFQINKSEKNPPENSFSLLTYNVRLFDLYNWTGNNKTRAAIFDLLNQHQPDIICFQEYYNSDKGDFQNTKLLKEFLHAKNAHVEYGVTLRKSDHWGLATFTKFPIVGSGKLLQEEGRTNFVIYTDIVIKRDTIRVYNAHLQSNHFKEKDYRFIEAPDSGSNEQIYQSTKAIIRRLKHGAVKRAEQIVELKEHMHNSPYPVIICGDFNDPPFSYVYSYLSDGMVDTFSEQGNGNGVTYAGKIPFYRIDYILHDPKIQCVQHEVQDVKLSDHKPVRTQLRIKN